LPPSAPSLSPNDARPIFIPLALLVLPTYVHHLPLSLSPFPFESSFTHAHRGRDHVFHTRVRVRASARARERAPVCVRAKIPRFSTESVESHLLLFPTRSLCPPQPPPRASRRSSVGSVRDRHAQRHHITTGRDWSR